jgi:hypothetical protein
MSDRLPERVVQARFSGYQEAQVCTCLACRVAGVAAPPVWVPDGREPRPGGGFQRMARRLHGYELARALRASAGFGDALEAFKARRSG